MELLYPDYYKTYVDNVTADSVTEALVSSYTEVLKKLEGIEASYFSHSYKEGKWTISQLVQHLVDTERIFSYRALHIARKDKTPLLSFDENKYAEASLLNIREKADLIQDYKSLRQSTIALFKSFNPEQLEQSTLLNVEPLSVAAIAFIIAGHELHHRRILMERYL